MAEEQVPSPVPPPAGTAPARREHRHAPSIVWPLLLIVVGTVLLLNTTGVLPWNVWSRLWAVWPAILVLVGLDLLLARSPYWVRVAIGILFVLVLVAAIVWLVWLAPPPAAGQIVEKEWSQEGIDRAEVEIRMGVGRLVLGPVEQRGHLAEIVAQTGGWPAPETSLRTSGGTAYLSIRAREGGWQWLRWNQDAEWQVRLTRDVPLRVRVVAGVSRSDLDLSVLQVEEFSLEGGVGEVQLILPARVRDGVVRIQGGVGAVHVLVPEGVAIEARVRGGVGNLDIDTGRFPKIGDAYRSSNYDRASYRLELEIEGGIGAVTVR
ncbi:MAG: LiaI-LiaF-like domain-containing protein [Chloroflexia bacterium]